MYWYWIHVYNNGSVVGSFYTETSNRIELIKQINTRYGEGKWTRFTAE